MAAPRTHRPRVGVLGAGQLVRMDLPAAIALDVELVVLADSEDDAAVLAGATGVVGDHRELDVLRAFARDVDVVTFEFEGVDPDHLATLAEEGVRLVPAPAAKLLAQDKLLQRRALRDGGFPVPPFAHAARVEEVEAFAAEHGGWPVVLKVPRGGYDGRGVAVIEDADAAAAFLDGLPAGALVEPALAIERELAVQVARTSDGATATYPVVETVQVDAMLRELIAPAPVDAQLARDAEALATAIVDHVGATGLVAVELFVTPAGLQVNELAMRPHNSGHHTIEATTTSQFEQHVRAALDLPLGATDLVAPVAVTVNVVGPADGSDPRDRRAEALAVAGAHVHLYGKEARPGRKLGHVTALADDVETARAIAWRAASILEGAPAPVEARA